PSIGAAMRNLSTTIAVYEDDATAEHDWDRLEHAGQTHDLRVADAALVKRDCEGPAARAIHRQSHHGWGKGAVGGAVVGVLFPATIVGAAVVGAIGGSVVAHFNRSLDRGDIKELGEAMDACEIAIVVVTETTAVSLLKEVLTGATTTVTKASSTAEDVQEALEADEKATG